VKDLDAIMTATPWELHTPVAVAAMKAGKYAATEVSAAITTEQCWELVNTNKLAFLEWCWRTIVSAGAP
jgi:predicted dehydrogenase